MQSPQQISELLARGRAAAEQLMTDTATISRASGQPVTDPVTGEVTQHQVTVYEGRARIQSRNLEDQEKLQGAQRFTLGSVIVQVPVTVELAVDDEVTITSSPTDPLQVGRVLRVVSVPRKTHATMTRAGAEEVTG